MWNRNKHAKKLRLAKIKDGICAVGYCYNDPLPNLKICLECREKQNKRSTITRNKLKKEKACTDSCGREAIPGRTRCFICLVKRSEKAKRRRDENRRNIQKLSRSNNEKESRLHNQSRI